MKKIRVIGLGAAVIVTIVVSSLASGLLVPGRAKDPAVTFFEFRPEYKCNPPVIFANGVVGLFPSQAENLGLVPGEYNTEINVHNPSHSVTLNITKTFLNSIVEPVKGTVRNSAVRTWTVVPPGGAFLINCQDIYSVEFGCASFTCSSAAKGFVVLTVPTKNLDVWAEYTSESFNMTPATNIFTPLCAAPSCVSTGLSISTIGPIPAQPVVP